MSLFSNKQMRIIFIYCVIIILVICGIITARHKKTSSDSIVKTTKINNETSESSDTQHTSDTTPNSDRLPPYNSSNQGNGIGGGAIPGSVIIIGHDFFFLLSTDGMSDNALTILGFLFGRNGSAILNTV